MRKKLIEVALPLEAINKASAREKSIRHGHPSTLHLWWARRPLAACRAVLFASIVDDPGQPDVPPALLTEIDKLPAPAMPREEWLALDLAEQRRQRLFAFIERLVQWENSTDEGVIGTARKLILAATDGNPPPVLDPFCGGGSIPLEAQRLGLEAHASDLNPVAVLITKALIEIPPKFAGMPPVNPESRRKAAGAGAAWKGAAGLAEDVRYYGKWMRDEAERRIGHLYPKVQLPKEYGGGEATVIAWLWARTVKCPNPACGSQMPLVRSFAVSTRTGKQMRVRPIIERDPKPPAIRFRVESGASPSTEGTVNRKGARCIVCDTSVPFDYVRAEGRAGRIGAYLMAIVAEARRGRVYLPPAPEHETIVAHVDPDAIPETNLPSQALGFRIQNYGISRHSDLFTMRQLATLGMLSELVSDVRRQIEQDVVQGGLPPTPDSQKIIDFDPAVYADSVATYLGLAVSKLADYNSSFVIWSPARDQAVHVFGRQAISMVWDYAEVNPFAKAAGDLSTSISGIAESLERLFLDVRGVAVAKQSDAKHIIKCPDNFIVVTDPPYYDNIGYADLSDYFYCWLRKSLIDVHQNLFRTLLTPKSEEIIANPFRFGGDRTAAADYFEEGIKEAFGRIHEINKTDFPLTLFYAFKQTEEEGQDEDQKQAIVASTGWETMLTSLINAGFSVRGTWPMRTERPGRLRETGSNALASSIVLVCRPRSVDAPLATRRDFLNALQGEIPPALRDLQRGNVAPVDMAQASIGPGMAIFSRYSKVLEADGTPMGVRTALALINQALDAFLTEQEGEYDADTRWALTWYEQHSFGEGPFGDAETLSKAKNTAVRGMEQAKIIVARAGKVRLLRRDELPDDWNPATDERLAIWELTQHLVRRLEIGGEVGAAWVLARAGAQAEAARDLAYRLYSLCERKGWAQEALAYNGLVTAWPAIAAEAARAAQAAATGLQQGRLV